MVLHLFTDGLETREVRWAAHHGLRNPKPAATRCLLICCRSAQMQPTSSAVDQLTVD